jgi:hypothetical protein
MSEPLVVSIPHRLGKDKALRRLKTGLPRLERDSAICSASMSKFGQATILALASAH